MLDHWFGALLVGTCASISEDNLTNALNAAATGDQAAAEQLFPLVYEELRRLAHARMAKLPAGRTLQPTALVHEAYLRITGRGDGPWEGRNHFFFNAARAMRDLLVEDARRRSRLKRGGQRKRIPLQDTDLVIEVELNDVLAVNEALEKFEAVDPEKAQIVTLRFFGGLSNEECAEVLGLSLSAFERQWRYVRTWLRRELSSSSAASESPETSETPETP